MTSNSTSVKKLETHELAPLLAEPEPMWVAVVSLQPELPEAPAPSELAGELERRLQSNLRGYDELYELPNGLFAIVLRTLADAATLAPRLQRVYDAIKLPYVVDSHRHHYRVLLGAAIRWPEEGVDGLLARVTEAVRQAETTGAVAPVLLED
jgi:hypothetical protein